MRLPFFQKNNAPSHSATPRKHKRVARYDFSSNKNEAGGDIRRLPKIEIGAEEEMGGGQLTLANRYKAINYARNLYRNSSLFRSYITTLQTNVIGSNCDLQFYRQDDDWYRMAETAFSRWAKKANFRDGSPLIDLLKTVLYTLLCEGDAILIFDFNDGCIDGTGKITLIEPDQICPLADADFQKYAAKGYTQKDGIILDKFGRMVGAIVSAERGAMSVPEDKAMILWRDPYNEDENWIYVRRSFRAGQTRGTADALPVLADCVDVHEILNYLKISAKRESAEYAYIVESQTESPITPTGFVDPSDLANLEDDEEEFSVEALQQVTGGMIDLLPPNSTVGSLPHDRPSANIQLFIDSLREICGASFGLTRSFALSKADTSYTSARWDSGLAQRMFATLQQFLDDHILDWLAKKAIDFLIENGDLPPAPEGWEKDIAWSHPTGREVLDEQKEISANTSALKAGLANYEQILGPNWKKIMDQLAYEKAYAKRLGLNLGLDETVSGQIIENNNDNNDSELN